MKLIEAKCPKCKEIIEVDGDSETTKCNQCGEKIDVKEALIEKMMSKTEDEKDNEKEKIETSKEIEEVKDEISEELEQEEVIETEEIEDDYPNDKDDDDDEEIEEDEDLDDDDDDEDDDEDDDDEEEFDEDIEQEKIVEETNDLENEKTVEENKAAKKEKKVTKKLTKEKKIEKDKLLLDAERFFRDNNYDEAYSKYQSALEIDPTDSYCNYRLNYISFLKDYINKEKLEDLYESLFDVDYCFDEKINKTNKVRIVQNEFVNCVIATSYAVYFGIAYYSRQSFEHLKKYYNIWYTMLNVLEKYAKEDVDGETKINIYNCILVIIDYLNGKYEYRDNHQRKFKNEEHIDILNKKHDKYINKLEKINSSYARCYHLNYSNLENKIKVPHIHEASECTKEDNVIVKAIDSIFSKYPKTTLALIFLLIYFIIKLIFS